MVRADSGGVMFTSRPRAILLDTDYLPYDSGLQITHQPPPPPGHHIPYLPHLPCSLACMTDILAGGRQNIFARVARWAEQAMARTAIRWREQMTMMNDVASEGAGGA